MDSYNRLEHFTKFFSTKPPSSANTRVDIVVVSYNSLDYLKKCLESLEQYADYPYALYVVDNASTDGSREFLKTLTTVTVILADANQGYAKACNQGARAGTGSYILFLNADSEAAPNFLRPMVRCFESDPHIAVVGPKLVNFENKIVGAGVVGTNATPRLQGWMEPDGPDKYSRQMDCLSMCGAAYMIRRDLIPRLGLFDEHYFFYYEETDYSYNARKNGYRVVYCPGSRMYHAVAGSSHDSTPEQLRALFMDSERYFQQKWSDFLKEETLYGDQ